MYKMGFPLLILILGSAGCAQESITDEDSYQTPPLLTESLDENIEPVEVYTDAMQRDGQFPKEVVIDTDFYQDNEISRGDIVYLVIPEDKAGIYSHGNAGGMIARIVALPNETVTVENGQIQINGALLDTFYGREFRWAGGQTAEPITDFSHPDFTVPEGSYSLSGDNWWRSPINITSPPVPEEFIEGKVIGYTK